LAALNYPEKRKFSPMTKKSPTAEGRLADWFEHPRPAGGGNFWLTDEDRAVVVKTLRERARRMESDQRFLAGKSAGSRRLSPPRSRRRLTPMRKPGPKSVEDLAVVAALSPSGPSPQRICRRNKPISGGRSSVRCRRIGPPPRRGRRWRRSSLSSLESRLRRFFS
jgi:hypothetical protein